MAESTKRGSKKTNYIFFTAGRSAEDFTEEEKKEKEETRVLSHLHKCSSV